MNAGSNTMELVALPGIPGVREGDDVGDLVADAMARTGRQWQTGDIVVIAQKIVSKAEGRTRRLADIYPSHMAWEYASVSDKDPRKVQAMLDESVDVVRVAKVGPDGLMITRHRHGWVCANAAIDESNVGEDGTMLLLPVDPDASAAEVARKLEARGGIKPGVIISDTFGRAWRRGLVNVAIGAANVPVIVDWIGRVDAYGRPLQVSQPAFADEVAAAAGLLMGKDSFTPVVLVRGLSWDIDNGAHARQLVRPLEEDLFQ